MILRGVKFGDYHSAGDWGLILNSKQLDPPEPKIYTVSVDGRDGDIDLSEALTGEIKYNNRVASFGFTVTEGSYADREAMIGRIVGLIHGRKLNIIIDDDFTHYLHGRVKVTGRTNINAYGTLTIECDCEPWRYAVNETVRTIALTTTPTEILLTNGGIKTLIPTVKVTDSATIEMGSSSVSLSSGEYKLTDLKLKSGSTLIKVHGNGTIIFSYREGIL